MSVLGKSRFECAAVSLVKQTFYTLSCVDFILRRGVEAAVLVTVFNARMLCFERNSFSGKDRPSL